MDKLEKINTFLQFILRLRGQDTVTAVAAARWLDAVGLLEDSATRPGKPLRDLLRAGWIKGQRQERQRFWFIDRV